MDKSREPLLKPGSLDLHLALRSHFGHYFLFWRASREYQFRKPQYCHNLSVGRVWVALICGLSPPQIKEAMTMVFDAFSRRKLHVPSSTNESRGPYCVCIRVVKLNLWLIYRSIREISVHPKVPFAINSSPQISHKLVEDLHLQAFSGCVHMYKHCPWHNQQINGLKLSNNSKFWHLVREFGYSISRQHQQQSQEMTDVLLRIM